MQSYRAIFLSVLFSLVSFGLQADKSDIIKFKPNDALYVKLGKTLYGENCASCHGINLEGQEGWRDQMVDGMRLAPPHDETGHTWHHADELLFKITKYGYEALLGREYKVSMPVYDGLLKDDEIIAILSYIKSTWPKHIVEVHDKINADYNLSKANKI